MLIASKYEEIWAPEIRDFVYISDKAYTREQIISMEKLMLNTLGFKLTLPTPYNFLARFLKAAGAHLDKQVRDAGQDVASRLGKMMWFYPCILWGSVLYFFMVLSDCVPTHLHLVRIPG